ncbi:MAG: hypothetical protein RR444_06480, partial [Oscillospiraceae bacterium]
RKEPFLWLYSTQDKEKIISVSIDKFKKVFGAPPLSVGSYHMDNVSMKLLKQISPQTKITIGGCFEEGVKVFHGCNNSWYLFNEGMPFFPWYPSLNNTLVPAKDESDWEGIVAVPHLSRDLALSYEGRNDFFASHPANVQRAMANEGSTAPYTFNLLDMYRFQERYNDGFSYTNVFVGPGWLSGNPNVQDSDEVTQNMYREYLEYFAELKSTGELTDMYMGEFADWFKSHVEIGKPQRYFAKEILYGSGKHYFWYIDSQMRVTFDMEQGGSIGDFRPFCAHQERHTGRDCESLAMASNPYLIHSQYRSGNSYHYADGARTTLLLEHDDEVIDLCDYKTKILDLDSKQGETVLTLTPVTIQFKSGLFVTLKTVYRILDNGELFISSELLEISDETASIKATEYFKGCYGVTEYPENLKGILLQVKGKEEKSLVFDYSSEEIFVEDAEYVSAQIPQLDMSVKLLKADAGEHIAEAIDGYLFSPFYTLKLSGKLSKGKEMCSCLKITKL